MNRTVIRFLHLRSTGLYLVRGIVKSGFNFSHDGILWVMLAVGMVGCVDQIPLTLPEGNGFLIVQGQLTNRERAHTILLSRSAYADAGTTIQPGDPITEALVSVRNTQGNEAHFTEVLPGRYECDPDNLRGEIGQEYQLTVLVDDKTYRSTWERMSDVAAIGDIHFDLKVIPVSFDHQKIVETQVVQIYHDFVPSENMSTRYMRWLVTGEYQFNEVKPVSPMEVSMICYVTDHLANDVPQLVDMAQLNRSVKSRFHLMDLPVDYKLATNYCIHIQQLSISETAFKFWSAVKQIQERKGTLLDELVGRVRGNIVCVDDSSEEVFGYFSATAVQEKRVFVPAEITLQQISPCPPVDFTFRESCLDCLTIEGSSTIKPSYWP